LHLTSVAFPSISTGAYGYPVQEASTVALSSVVRFLSEEADSVTRVVFVLFDKATLEAYRCALQAIERS
jgi:O-acetyl-ADP-ribose deacetylase (regulator of RNase III)